ncbi:MAG: glutathione peroxidase [Clostridiales bacterium]|jgi:glutathione peroxidase|nr:glutathione peroxidase [Clostridiales bacterium]
MDIYDFTVKDAAEIEVSFKGYRGKVLLIVNTATNCGFTPQYSGLQDLYDKYGEQGFEILDFPCNQFAHQAPGNNAEINQFCELKYKTTFKRFDKIEVNGKNEIPLYTFLKGQNAGKLGSKIKWNFTKFLIDSDGSVVKRFSPTTKPQAIEKEIATLLNAKQ